MNPAASEVCNDQDDNCDGLTDEGLLQTYYADADGDRYGDPTETTEACYAPEGFVVDGTDCDDTARSINPAALERCDGLDNDCDGTADPGCSCTDGTTRDCGDSDVGECSLGTQRCIGGVWAECIGAVGPRTESCNSVDDDCDGSVDEEVGPTWYLDSDGDGYGVVSTTVVACTRPSGYAGVPDDCDDTRAAIHPSAPEICDGIDNNCDASVDPDCTCVTGETQPCGESDVGECERGVQRCIDGVWGECVGAVGPAAEQCNSLDDDCDVSVDEGVLTTYYLDGDGDGFGTVTTTQDACVRPAGYSALSTDCVDTDGAVNPAAVDLCNGRDDDCDDAIDEGCDCTDGDTQSCSDSDVGECERGTQVCIGGAWGACIGDVGPAEEVCDGLDNDCDSFIDEGTTASCRVDGDGDGYGAGAVVEICAGSGGGCPTNYSAVGGDCNDSSSAINPGASELCNGVDDDCSGAPDDGSSMICALGSTRSGSSSWGTCSTVSGIFTCDAGCTSETFTPSPPPETCDGDDEDCDGVVDDGFECIYRSSGNPCTTSCSTLGTYTCSSSCTPGTCRTAGEGPSYSGTCNGCDDDNDGRSDEGFTCRQGSSRSCTTGCGTSGSQRCRTDCSDWEVCRASSETCNGCDDDGDGAADDGYACVQGQVLTCTTACGTGGSRTCTNSCSVPSECYASGESCNYCDDNGAAGIADESILATLTRSDTVDGCWDVNEEGDATCSSAVTTLADGTYDDSGFLWPWALTVGFETLSFQACVRVSEGSSSYPGYGWALVAYTGTGAAYENGGGCDLGVNRSRRGYSAEWRFCDYNASGDSCSISSQSDEVIGRELSGTGSAGHYSSSLSASPRLDNTTSGSIYQCLRMNITGDVPGTSTNEMSVTLEMLDAASSYSVSGTRTICSGSTCDTQIEVGDAIEIGMTAATYGYWANIEQRSLTNPCSMCPDFQWTAGELCP